MTQLQCAAKISVRKQLQVDGRRSLVMATTIGMIPTPPAAKQRSGHSLECHPAWQQSWPYLRPRSVRPPFPEGKQAEDGAFFVACSLCVWWPAARASNPPSTLCPVFGEDSTTLRQRQLNSFLQGFTVHSLIPGAGSAMSWVGMGACSSLTGSLPSPVQWYSRMPLGYSKCKTASQKQVFDIPRSPSLKVVLQVIFVS